MKDKYAIAAALTGLKRGYIFGLRTSGLIEYRNTWSLLSATVSEEAYKKIVRSGHVPEDLSRACSKKWFQQEKSFRLKFVRAATRIRQNYRLHLALVEGHLTNVPEPLPSKYSKLELFDIEECLERLQYQVSTCVSLLIQELVQREEVDSAIDYLEVQPELADHERPLTEFTAHELWERALPNYVILRAGESGSDGELIRSNTIDLFLNQYLENINSSTASVLDLGCGGGDLVAELTRKGIKAIGADLLPDPLGKYVNTNVDLRSIKAEDVANHFVNI